MKAKPCIIHFNSPLNGYCFKPIECKSISEAINLAKEKEYPYRLYDNEGNLFRKGWIVH